MPIFNAEVTGTALPPIPDGHFYTWYRLPQWGDTLLITDWPSSSSSPVGGLAYLVRLEADGTATVGTPYDLGGVGGTSFNAPEWTFLSATRAAFVRYVAHKSWVVELYAVDLAALTLSQIAVSDVFVAPYTSGDFQNGSISPTGVVCVVANKFVSGQPQDTLVPNTYGFGVCQVNENSIGPWSFREHTVDGYKTKMRSWPLSGTRFFLPWTVGSGNVIENWVYDSAADTLTLASRSADEQYNASLTGLDYGPAHEQSVNMMRAIGSLPDNQIQLEPHAHNSGWAPLGYALYEWNGSELVRISDYQVFTQGHEVFEETPEYYEEEKMYNFGGAFTAFGSVYDNEINYNWKASTIRPDVTGSLLYVMRWRDDHAQEMVIYDVGRMSDGRWWLWGYVNGAQAVMQMWPIEPELEVVELAGRARFW